MPNFCIALLGALGLLANGISGPDLAGSESAENRSVRSHLCTPSHAIPDPVSSSQLTGRSLLPAGTRELPRKLALGAAPGNGQSALGPTWLWAGFERALCERVSWWVGEWLVEWVSG